MWGLKIVANVSVEYDGYLQDNKLIVKGTMAANVNNINMITTDNPRVYLALGHYFQDKLYPVLEIKEPVDFGEIASNAVMTKIKISSITLNYSPNQFENDNFVNLEIGYYAGDMNDFKLVSKSFSLGKMNHWTKYTNGHSIQFILDDKAEGTTYTKNTSIVTGLNNHALWVELKGTKAHLVYHITNPSTNNQFYYIPIRDIFVSDTDVSSRVIGDINECKSTAEQAKTTAEKALVEVQKVNGTLTNYYVSR